MRYIAYYRKSPGGNRDENDLRNSLSISSQKNIVGGHLVVGDELIGEYIETETGTNKKHRPVIEEAIKEAKKRDAILLIANISRLARNVNFVSGLQDSGVKFKCCDMPEADNFTIHIMAALAQREAENTSRNTKNTLSELKKRGVKLGNPYKGGEKMKKNGKIAKVPLGVIAVGNSIATRIKKARENENNTRAMTVINGLRGGEVSASYEKIAVVLNNNGFRTSQGKGFNAIQVQRLYNRLQKQTIENEPEKKLSKYMQKKRQEDIEKEEIDSANINRYI